MITSNNPDIIKKASLLRNHGASDRYYHVDIGWNYRMIDFAAALGLVQLKRLESVIEQKNIIAKEYDMRLKDIKGVKSPIIREYNRHTFMLYSVLFETHEAREKVKRSLYESGIESRICFPPVHLQPVYENLLKNKYNKLPITEETSQKILSLPIHYNLTKIQINEIATIIERGLNEKQKF
jgi:perosamine synthetase